MNNPSPFNPQSSASEQKNQSRARVRTAVTLVFAVNFVALMALLLIGFGCRKPAEPEVAAPETNTSAMTMPAFDTNSAALPGTNAPATTNATAYVPPTPEPIAPVVTPAAGQEHVIVKGDTFETLHKTYHVSVKAIEDANPGVDPKKLKINQKINIPAPPAAATTAITATPAATDTAAGEVMHKVKSGDTLTTLSKHYGVSVKAIRAANNLTTDKIKVGDKLKIPAKTSAPAPDTAPVTTPKSL